MVLSSFAFANTDSKSDNDNKTTGQKVMLANNGRAMYHVYVDPNADAIERHAAEELVQYLTKVTGAKFALSTEDSKGPTLVVGNHDLTKRLMPDLAEQQLGDDGFVIRNVKHYVVIAGNSSRGTMYGVNYFLDYYVGVKWFSPTYTYIPDIRKLNLTIGNDVQVPRFQYREMFVNDDNNEQFRAHNLLNGKYGDRPQQSIPELDSWSQFWPYNTHNFFSIVPDPALHSGGQLLAMNEDVRQIAATNLIAIIKEKAAAGKTRLSASVKWTLSGNPIRRAKRSPIFMEALCPLLS